MIYEIIVQAALDEDNNHIYKPIFRGFNDEPSQSYPFHQEQKLLKQFVKENGINPALIKMDYIDCKDVRDAYDDCFMCMGTGDMNHKTGCQTGPHVDEPYQACDHCLGAGVDKDTNSDKPFFNQVKEWMEEMDQGKE